MVHRARHHSWAELQAMLTEHERYRAALGAIHDTATVAAQCPCCLLVARVADLALAAPSTPANYWLHCEA